ncbi:MAG TPA: GDCCVxC domain-containing (seleno)protein [Nitrospiraceae bacterium]|nr:GDCCVxC domain-containing (seleno)protein [Nitrospiraceae bacterium]
METVNRCVLTCPHCGTGTEQEMPENACVVFFQCPSCKSVLRPLSGDCCVFCSYGNVKCPPVQLQTDRCP